MSSATPHLIIVTGHPASGKTTLASRLATDLNFPCLVRDDIKEKLFDTLGWSDREWSKKLGRTTYELIYLFSEIQLRVGCSFLLEFNFDSEMVTPRFLEIKRKHYFYPIQIVLEADDEILLARFQRRADSGERHPGNVDHTLLDEYRARLAQGPYRPLNIGGSVIRASTNDFKSFDYERLLKQVQIDIEIHQSPFANLEE